MAAPAQGPPGPAPFPGQAGEDYINHWRGIRGQPPQTTQEIQACYRIAPYMAPLNLPAQAIPYYPLFVPTALVGPNFGPLTQQEATAEALRQAWLALYPTGMTGGTLRTKANHWRGTKFLGEGGQGKAGLWEYTPGNQALPVTQIVVKDSKPKRNGDLRDLTGEFNAGFARNVSEHSVTTYRGYPRNGPPTTRLFMEYCPLGDLQKLLYRRCDMEEEFQERTLWAIFNCLVDGIAVITDEIELTSINTPGGAVQYSRNPRTVYGQPCDGLHFDLKADNVFIGYTDPPNHPEPALKIADYGLFEDIPTLYPWPPNGWGNYMEELRYRGDPGHYAPEQFTARWDYSDLLNGTEPIAGRYGAKTNVWAIGNIMFMLLTLTYTTAIEDEDSEDADTVDAPYRPTFVNSRPALGSAYGWKLQNFPRYSVALKELIIECLYENPVHRPSIETLKQQVMVGLRTARAANPVAENYNSYLAWDDPILVARRAVPAVAIPAMPTVPAVSATLRAAQIARRIVDSFGGRPTLPDPRLNGLILKCNARIPRQNPTKFCENTFTTDGLRGTCGVPH